MTLFSQRKLFLNSANLKSHRTNIALSQQPHMQRQDLFMKLPMSIFRELEV